MSTNDASTAGDAEAQGAAGAAGADAQGTGAGDAGDAGEHRGGDQGKLTSENRGLRERLRAAEAERDRLKTAGQTDLERAQAKAEQAETRAGSLEGELQGLRLEVAIGRVAPELGIIDPDGAMRMIDRDAITYEDGRPTASSVKTALRELVKTKTYLVRQGGADQGGGQDERTATTGDMNAILRAGRGG